MRSALLGSVLAAAYAAGSLGVLRDAHPEAVTFAAVRGDGVLIPFATRIGERRRRTRDGAEEAWRLPSPRIASYTKLGLAASGLLAFERPAATSSGRRP